MFAFKKYCYYDHPEKEVIIPDFAAYRLKEYVGPVNLSSKPEARGCAHTESARMRNGHINDHQVRTELQGRPPSAIELPSSRPLKGPCFVSCHRRLGTYGWIYVVGCEMFSRLTVLACTRVHGHLGLDQIQHPVPGIVRSLTAGGLGLGPGEVGFVVSRPLGRAGQ